MNRFIATGRLGDDAILRHTDTANGPLAVANFSLAVDVGYGQNKSTLWTRCALWGKRAESLVEYLKKGSMVAVSGEASLRAWQTNSGETKTDFQCRVEELTLLVSKPAEEKPNASPEAKAPAPDLSDDDMDDDIPF